MKGWYTILSFHTSRLGIVGVVREARRRILGPSNRELLLQLRKLEKRTRSFETLIERFDATVRYVAEKARTEGEQRIVDTVEQRLQRRFLASDETQSQIVTALKALHERLDEIYSSITDLEKKTEK